MSGPVIGLGGRNLQGTGTRNSASDLLKQADELRKVAQIQQITAQDDAREGLWQSYLIARDANMAAGRTLPPAVFDRLFTFTHKLDGIGASAQSLKMVVPVPVDPADLARNPYQRQRSYQLASINTAIATAQDGVSKALSGAADEAAAIVDAAWLSVEPPRPDRGVLATSLDLAIQSVRHALTAGRKPKAILKDAIQAGDATLIYTMLGSEAGKRLMLAFGANRTALVQLWAADKLAAAAPDEYGVRRLGMDFAAANFLQLQSTDQALANLPGLAQSYFAATLQRGADLLASEMIRDNSRG